MDSENLTPPGAVRALYSPQRVPAYRGNPLIEALPPIPSDADIVTQLMRLPEFSEEQRGWTSEERLQCIAQLSHFFYPLARHVELVRSVDTMMREGYVGRAPQSRDHARISQRLYEQQKSGTGLGQVSFHQNRGQLTRALIGLSGIGKTSVMRAYFNNIPPVIYHPDFDLFQVPYLHIETPSDGRSIKAMAHGIIRRLDQLIPDAHYLQLYGQSRKNADSLLHSAANLMHQHGVGILVADEIQNVANASRGDQILLTQLVAMSNELGVPILMVGTSKAQRIFSQDLRGARRAAGLRYWDRLSAEPMGTSGRSEFDEFLEGWWNLQWVQTPAPLTPAMRQAMFHYSQGLSDIALKLFAIAQVRAILSGQETVTPELVAQVAENELKLVAPMLRALRNNDAVALTKYEDICAPSVEEVTRELQLKARRPVYSLPPLDGAPAAPVESVAGAPHEDAPRKKRKAAPMLEEPTVSDDDRAFAESLSPGSLIGALARAKREGIPVMQVLEEQGSLCNVREVLNT